MMKHPKTQKVIAFGVVVVVVVTITTTNNNNQPYFWLAKYNNTVRLWKCGVQSTTTYGTKKTRNGSGRSIRVVATLELLTFYDSFSSFLGGGVCVSRRHY
jgi:hypothetical protein